MGMQRQLSAVVFTDIQGYTSLMQEDEVKAIHFRDRHREIFDRCTAKFNGKILQYYGDGTLSVFDSSADAVLSSIEMQLEFIRAQIPVRIGINSGDVLTTEDDIAGNAVNVASRIENLAIPGSVLISGKVHEEITGYTEIQRTYLGRFRLKNVSHPVRIFAVSGEGLVVPKSSDLRTSGSHRRRKNALVYLMITLISVGILYTLLSLGLFRTSTQQPLEKSIAVLPFVSFSEGEDKQYFADGMMEAILNHVSRIDEVKVISRTSVEQYRNTTKTIPDIAGELNVAHILEGSAQLSENKVRITVQLISKNDEHLWSQNFDRELSDIFEIQSEIASVIANRLQAEISPEDLDVINRPASMFPQAYNLMLKGRGHLTNFIRTGDLNEFDESIRLNQMAIQLDSTIGGAYYNLAYSFWRKNRVQYLDTVEYLCKRALHFNSNMDYPHWLLGRLYWEKGEDTRGVHELEKALAINSNNSGAYNALGQFYSFSGNWIKGIPLLQKAIEIDPSNEFFRINLAQAYVDVGDYEKGIERSMEGLRMAAGRPNPTWYGNSILVYAYMGLDDSPNAHRAADKVINHNPLYGIELKARILILLDREYSTAKDLLLVADTGQYALYKPLLASAHIKLEEMERGLQAARLAIRNYLYLLEESSGRRGIMDRLHYDLAGCYALTGDEKKSYEVLKKVIFLNATIDLIDADPMFDTVREFPVFQSVIGEARSRKAKAREVLNELSM